MTTISVVARAPGRVNLIGEHTDYNDGFVLPMALPFATRIEATARPGRSVSLVSEGYGSARFDLDEPMEASEDWARYVAAMAHLLIEEGVEVPGFDAHITTDIPVGASLSSSAALEVAAGFAMVALAGGEPDPVQIARLGQRVENEVMGLQSGIMDQLISAVATEGRATLIDCRSLDTELAPLPADTVVAIMDTMTRRELVDSAYDERRASCERAARALGVPALRDATHDAVERLPDGVDKRRARHVVAENERVLAAVRAMRAGDAAQLGRLMNDSHRSLSDDYEVSSPALDSISSIARSIDGCHGARMTGGGFAGCAVALVDRTAAPSFIEELRSRYEDEMGAVPDVWLVEPADGASVGCRDA